MKLKIGDLLSFTTDEEFKVLEIAEKRAHFHLLLERISGKGKKFRVVDVPKSRLKILRTFGS